MKTFADSHVHIRFTRFDEIRRMLDDLSTTGLTDVCLLPLPYRGAAENLAALYWKTHYDKMNIRAYGGLHVTDRYAKIPYETLVEHLLDLGCDGIKIMNSPDSRRFRGYGLNDMRFDAMFTMLEERGTPLNIHVTDPETFWNEGKPYHDPSFPSTELLYSETFELLARYPKLNVVFAHFFFLSNKPEEAVRVMETYPNVKFDLTPGVEMYYNFDNNLDFWHDFFIKYADRLLFGTDSNTLKTCNKELVALVYRKLTEKHDYFTQNCYGRDFVIRGLELPENVVEKICGLNYLGLVGEKKPVDQDKFYACCERVLHDIRKNPVDEIYAASGEFIPDLLKDPMQKNATDFCEKALAERT